MTLIVDDREVGLLPQTIKDMTPGEHVIKIIDKNQRFKPFEQRVTVEPDKILPRAKLKVPRDSRDPRRRNASARACSW